jgi:hypothetical protein
MLLLPAIVEVLENFESEETRGGVWYVDIDWEEEVMSDSV